MPTKPTARIRVTLLPFTSPSFATIEGVDRGLALREVPLDALDTLAERWIADLYEKAAATPPKLVRS